MLVWIPKTTFEGTFSYLHCQDWDLFSPSFSDTLIILISYFSINFFGFSFCFFSWPLFPLVESWGGCLSLSWLKKSPACRSVLYKHLGVRYLAQGASCYHSVQKWCLSQDPSTSQPSAAWATTPPPKQIIYPIEHHPHVPGTFTQSHV